MCQIQSTLDTRPWIALTFKIRCGSQLYAFVRRQGHGAQDAEDLTQEFFARFLAKEYFGRADRHLLGQSVGRGAIWVGADGPDDAGAGV